MFSNLTLMQRSMPAERLRLVVYCVLALGFVVPHLVLAGQTRTGNEVQHIVVVGVDGMSPNGVLHADTPNMKRLREEGSWTFHARGVMPTVSSPNWASMIMGAGPEQARRYLQ